MFQHNIFNYFSFAALHWGRACERYESFQRASLDKHIELSSNAVAPTTAQLTKSQF